MNKIVSWKKIRVQPGVNSLPNLWVCSVDGVEIGMVQKPRNTRHVHHAWRAYLGIGDKATFLGHVQSFEEGRALVENRGNA
jgi:hypothetical protein